MAFNLALIIFMWIALRFEKRDLGVFGFGPLPKRLYQLILGLSLSIALSTFINLLFALSANFGWIRNEHYELHQLFNAVYYTFNSVVFEELVFRSYALYKLNQLFGEQIAVLSTSIAFGIYHWFTLGALGNVTMMTWVFFNTGLWGVMFAYCYTRTGTLLLATGLHWGWNFFEQVIFTKNGDGLLKPLTSPQTEFLDQMDGFVITSFPPILFAVAVILYLVRRKRAGI